MSITALRLHGTLGDCAEKSRAMHATSCLASTASSTCCPLTPRAFNATSTWHVVYSTITRSSTRYVNYSHPNLADLIDGQDPSTRSDLFEGDIIQTIINKVFYKNPADDGVIHDEVYRPFPIRGVALVLTAVSSTPYDSFNLIAHCRYKMPFKSGLPASTKASTSVKRCTRISTRSI